MLPLFPASFSQRIKATFGDEGEAWLTKLPEVCESLCKDWKLTLSPNQPELSYNFVCRVQREDNSSAVLKIGIHMVGHLREVNSLIHFDGAGAVRVLERDSSRCAYLMEDVIPGSELKALFGLGFDDEPTRICATLIRKLQSKSELTLKDSFKPIAKLVDDFDNYLEKPSLTDISSTDVSEAKNIFLNLLQTTTKEVLLHGDLHHQNILKLADNDWLAIDPKGYVGDPCFEVGAFIRNPMPQLAEGPSLSTLLEKRISIFSEELGFLQSRITDWSYVQAILAAIWASHDTTEEWKLWFKIAQALNTLRDDKNLKNKKAYDLTARQYAGSLPAEDDPIMRKECRELFISSLKGNKILEVGCGPGTDSLFLTQAGLKVTATDFSEEFIKIVQERFPNIQTHQMNMTHIDLPKSSFDGIYSFASFVHIPRAQAPATLFGFFNVLRDDAVVFMSLIKSSKMSEYIIDDWAGRPNNPLLFTCYSHEEIEKLLLQAGFKKVKFFSIRSELYENLPRLAERGVSHYQVLAFK